MNSILPYLWMLGVPVPASLVGVAAANAAMYRPGPEPVTASDPIAEYIRRIERARSYSWPRKMRPNKWRRLRKNPYLRRPIRRRRRRRPARR